MSEEFDTDDNDAGIPRWAWAVIVAGAIAVVFVLVFHIPLPNW